MDTDLTEICMDEYIEEDPTPYFDNQPAPIPHYSLIKFYVMFLFMWRSRFRLSDTGTNVLLCFLATFLLHIATKFGSDS